MAVDKQVRKTFYKTSYSGHIYFLTFHVTMRTYQICVIIGTRNNVWVALGIMHAGTVHCSIMCNVSLSKLDIKVCIIERS